MSICWKEGEGYRERKDPLPRVAGRVMTISIVEFEHRCLVLLAQEQDALSSDSQLIGALCEAVRLAREFADAQAKSVQRLGESLDAGRPILDGAR